MTAAAASALLKVLRWWRPLVLGIPPKPTWYRRAKDVAASMEQKGDKALARLGGGAHADALARAARTPRRRAQSRDGRQPERLDPQRARACGAACCGAGGPPTRPVGGCERGGARCGRTAGGGDRRAARYAAPPRPQLASLAMTVCAASSGSDGAASARRLTHCPDDECASQQGEAQISGEDRHGGGGEAVSRTACAPAKRQPGRAAPPLWPASKALLALAARGGGGGPRP